MRHLEGKFPGRNNLNLYYQSWLPDADPAAVLIVVHGLAEHSGRYSNVVDYFVPRGYAVYSYDQRGHGKSEGRRGYVERFSYYIDDLKTFYDMVRRECESPKIFLVGHSIGGTVATAFTVGNQDVLDGLILSGAFLKAGNSVTKVTEYLAKILSFLAPKMGVTTIDASAVSSDKSVVDAYINDPLVYTGKISARFGVELLNTIESLPSKISSLALPLFIMHGTIDRLSDPEGSRMMFETARSKDKELKFYEGFYHEIFNEPGREQVFGDMEDWIKKHI